MKIRSISVVVLAFLGLSCGSGTHPVGPTTVTENYDTQTTISEKMMSMDERGEVNSLFLHVDGSVILDSLQPNLACSNIAIMTYGGLSVEDRQKYGQLFVVLTNNKSQKENTFQYDMQALGLPGAKRQLFVDFSQKILDTDYEGIAKQISPKFQTPTLGAELGNFMTPLIQKHGAVANYKSTHFGLATTKKGAKLYKFEGVLIFEDGYKRPYFITVPMEAGNNFVSGYQLDI
jgi:hypothetical protein